MGILKLLWQQLDLTSTSIVYWLPSSKFWVYFCVNGLMIRMPT